MATSEGNNIDFTRATLTILRAKYERLYKALGVKNANSFHDTFVKTTPSKSSLYKLQNTDFKDFSYNVFLALCDLYERMPAILRQKDVELPDFIADENHCAINLNKCPLPFFLEQAWFHKYDGIGDENRKQLCGKFNDFQRTNLDKHKDQILVGLTEISTSLVNEFLLVKRLAKVPVDPKEPDLGYNEHRYTGFLTSTPVGTLMTLYHDEHKAPIYYLFRPTLNSIGGYFSTLMLRQSSTGTKISKTAVALDKYAHQIGYEPALLKIADDKKFFSDAKFIETEVLEKHNHQIYYTVMHESLTLHS